jgi:hypothetical protein
MMDWGSKCQKVSWSFTWNYPPEQQCTYNGAQQDLHTIVMMVWRSKCQKVSWSFTWNYPPEQHWKKFWRKSHGWSYWRSSACMTGRWSNPRQCIDCIVMKSRTWEVEHVLSHSEKRIVNQSPGNKILHIVFTPHGKLVSNPSGFDTTVRLDWSSSLHGIARMV